MNKRSLWLATSSVLLALTFNHAHAFSCADTATTGVPQIECEALVALYDSTNGDGWRNNTNWKTATPLESWYGIQGLYNINVPGVVNGHVVNISLGSDGQGHSNQLSGMIPTELVKLANLQSLSLAGNQLSGMIPAELGKLVNLQLLSLAGNQLSGMIPAELGKLVNLQSLYLGGNQLSGMIPAELGKLANLQLLSLHSNQLSGMIPVELGNLTKLQFLSLDNNQLSGTIPTELSNLANLQSLNLQYNQLSGTIPTELSNLANLQSLNLQYNQLSGTISLELANLTNLKRLSLHNTQLSGKIPAELGNLTNLERLSLHNTQLSGKIPAELGNLTNLEWLSLNNTQLSGTIPAELGNLTNLEWLSLGNAQLRGTIPAELGNLTNLKRLSLHNAQLSGIIPAELGNLTKLETLILTNTQLSGKIPTEFSKLTNLEYLYLYHNHLTGDSPDASLAEFLNNLITLNINDNCLTPTDPTIRNILDIKDARWRDNQTNCQTPTFSCRKVTEIPTQECQALVTLYEQTNGDNWTNNGNWQQTQTPCDWYGITCNNGHIQGISLTNNQLSGELPDLALPKLTLLQLASNRLTGPLPNFATTPALTELNLAANQLTGNIPNLILANLNALFVENNQLGGIIPTFSTLAALDLSNNQLCADPSRDYGQWQDQADAYPQCQRTLKLIKRNTGQGHVTADDESIDCDTDCQVQKATYDSLGPAPLITLTATPAAGSTFLGWRGWGSACQSNALTTQVTIDKAQLCVAEFGLTSGNTFTVVKTGQGSGWIRTPLNTIYCNEDCLQDQATYPTDTTVTLLALPEPGSSFAEWSGDCSGTEPTITFTMNTDKDCTAKFIVTEPPPANMHTLTVQINPNTVTDSVTSTALGGINCPYDCVENYPVGQRVNLAAFPHSASQFIGWSGDCKHKVSDKSFVIMDGDKTCIAEFVGQ